MDRRFSERPTSLNWRWILIVEAGRSAGIALLQDLSNKLSRILFLVLAMVAIGPCRVVQAHTGERAFILLMPTHLYIFGGALVVALSFVVMALMPRAGLWALERARWRLCRLPLWGGVGPSLGTLALALGLLIAGHAGSRDPLANPLPLVVWTIWWVGFTFLHAILGNLWALFNPWLGVYRLLTEVPGLRGWRQTPPLGYPRPLGYWPAVLWFFAFAWFELVDPAPQDPERLANAIAAYLIATLLGMLLFGERVWLRHCEAFSVFFRIVAWISPLDAEQRPSGGGGGSSLTLSVTLPGSRLLKVGALPVSGVAFVLLVLASVSFDGLSRTFWWLDLVGVNPLEYPGRTVLIGANSLGLVCVFGALVTFYLAAVLLGRALAMPSCSASESFRGFIVSIVPIAFGYHFAHYLPAFLVDAQYALRALSDPFKLGWNLIGTGNVHVTTSFLTNHHSVQVIWTVQVVTIIAAHVLAVAIAHFLALRNAANYWQAVLNQVPMTVLMIGYTLFGIWLLATPAIG